MGFGLEAEFEDDEFFGENNSILIYALCERLEVCNLPDKSLVFLVEMSFQFFLVLYQQVDKLRQLTHATIIYIKVSEEVWR